MKSGADISVFSPSKMFGSAHESVPSNHRRHSLRMGLIPTINHAAQLQNEVLRCLTVRSPTRIAEADKLLQDGIQVLSQCADAPHPALDDITNSLKDIRNELCVGPTSKSINAKASKIHKENNQINSSTPKQSSDTRKDTIETDNVERKCAVFTVDDTVTYRPKAHDKTRRWNLLTGLVEAKTKLKEIIGLRCKFPQLVSGSSNNILLYGPPGTGKTSIVKAAADYFDWTVILISAGDIISKYCGDSEKRIRSLFKQAETQAPCILFLDELDSLGRARNIDSTDLCRRVLTELMIQLSMWEETYKENPTSLESMIVFIAATNEPWVLDGALLRRLAHKIYCPYWTEKEVLNYLERSMIELKFASKDCCEERELTIHHFVPRLVDYSPSEIGSIIAESSRMPIRDAIKEDAVFCECINLDDKGIARTVTRIHSDECLSNLVSNCTVLPGIGLDSVKDAHSLELRAPCLCDIENCITKTVKSCQYSIEKYLEWGK